MTSETAVDITRLERDSALLRAEFEAAEPFRHITIDNFLERGVAERLYAEFPRLDAVQHSLARALQARSYEGDVRAFGPAFEGVFAELQSETFAGWLRRLTRIDDLEIDSEFVGAGLHQGARGSVLHVHADHNTHPNDPSRHRRVNVLIYLNPHWQPEWRGELEIYDRRGSHVVKRIEPIFNRCIVMEVHDSAFHGYQPLRFPLGETRKSLAAYFYSDSPSPLQSRESHPTLLGSPAGSSRSAAFGWHLRHWVLHRLPGAPGLRPRRRR